MSHKGDRAEADEPAKARATILGLALATAVISVVIRGRLTDALVVTDLGESLHSPGALALKLFRRLLGPPVHRRLHACLHRPSPARPGWRRAPEGGRRGVLRRVDA